MDYNRFYAKLFKPIEDVFGPMDSGGITPIIGFDCGGPLNLSTVGRGREQFVTYVSCELAVTAGQRLGDAGPFEVMMSCDSEAWAQDILTRIGRMSFSSVFEHGHTVDVGEIVGPDCPVQGLITEEFARVQIDGRSYGILRFHGTTRPELEFASKVRLDELLKKFKHEGIYPRTSVHRTRSVELSLGD